MSNKHELLGLDLRSYLDQIVQEPLKKFDAFITWTESDKNDFRNLLDELKNSSDNTNETAIVKGNKLESLVEFIIIKSYFFDIYRNVHTQTNEIDEIIVLSDRGKQAIHSLDLARDLIPIEKDLFLGECKNYKSKLGVTYVGKFYSLLSAAKISFGIIFTQRGLTGDSEGYKDAYGLTKVLRMVETSRGNDFYLLTFTLDDYEQLLEGTTFFELIRAKKIEMQIASNYLNFIKDNKHEAQEQIQKILKEYK